MNKKNFLTALENKNMSQKELAEKIGISEVTISRYFGTKTSRNPRSDILERIANELNVSVDYLMGRSEDPNLTVREHNNAKFYIRKGHENDYTEEDLEMALKIIDTIKNNK